MSPGFFDNTWFSMALRSIGDAVIATDADGHILFANPVAESLTGWPEAECRGKELTEVFHIVNERTRAVVDNPVEMVLREGHTVGLANHTVLISRDGRETPIDDSAAPIIDGEGILKGVVLVFRDVSEKRRSDLLRERLAAVVESSDDVILTKTLDGIITSWNRGAERVLGYTAEEVIGKHVSMLMPPDAIEDTGLILGRIRQGEKVDHYETRRVRKDGTIIDVSLTVSPIRNAEGEVIGASKVGRDVTEKRRSDLLGSGSRPSSSRPTTSSSPRRSTGSSRAGTGGPSGCSATPPRRSSASTSRCSCPPRSSRTPG